MEEIPDITCTKDGAYLFTSDISGNVKQWCLKRKSLIKDYGKLNDSCKIIRVTYDNKYLILCGKYNLMQFSLHDHKVVNLINNVCSDQDYNSIFSSAMSPNNEDFFVGDHAGNLIQFCIKPDRFGIVNKYDGLSRNTISSLAVTPNGESLFWGTLRYMEKICIKSQERVAINNIINQQWIYAMEIEPTGRFLLAACDRALIVWSVATLEPVYVYQNAHDMLIFQIGYTNNGNGLFTSDLNGVLKQWEINCWNDSEDKLKLVKNYGEVVNTSINRIIVA